MTILPDALLELCLSHYADVSKHDWVVKNAIPIPYFGDLPGYMRSQRRVVTAALNPSDSEFPRSGTPRFDVRHGLSGPQGLEEELSRYFTVRPYWEWFRHFEWVLTGLDASYGGLKSSHRDGSTALHLDLCSPIATSPTWSGLNSGQRQVLAPVGKRVFEMLVKALEPELVIASVGWSHLLHWSPQFANGRNWKHVVRHEVTKDWHPFETPFARSIGRGSYTKRIQVSVCQCLGGGRSTWTIHYRAQESGRRGAAQRSSKRTTELSLPSTTSTMQERRSPERKTLLNPYTLTAPR